MDNLNIEVVVNVLFYLQGSALCGSDVVASGSWSFASAWNHQPWPPMGCHGGSVLLQGPRGGNWLILELIGGLYKPLHVFQWGQMFIVPWRKWHWQKKYLFRWKINPSVKHYFTLINIEKVNLVSTVLYHYKICIIIIAVMRKRSLTCHPLWLLYVYL